MRSWLIDFDSTLAQTFSNQVRLINEHFGKNYRPEQFVSWGVENVLTPEEIEFMWSDQCFLNYDFQMSCPLLPHVVESIEKMAANGDVFTVVSDRPKALFEATRDWIYENLPYLPTDIVLTRSPHSKSDQDFSIPTKSQVALSHKLSYVIEDSPHHSFDLAERVYIEQVYLLDYPNNAHISHDKIKRVQSWEEIIA